MITKSELWIRISQLNSDIRYLKSEVEFYKKKAMEHGYEEVAVEYPTCGGV